MNSCVVIKEMEDNGYQNSMFNLKEKIRREKNARDYHLNSSKGRHSDDDMPIDQIFP